MCKLLLSFSLPQSLGVSMVELRVTVDEKFNKLLDKVVEAGVYQSKAELMRSATIYLLIQMGILKEHIESR
jgi:Arc/MetJ-type ribon-helix-helix transcriptional regulator